MNAVNKVYEWFDKNQNVLLRFGGLFAFIFLVIFVPLYIQQDLNDKLSEQIIENRQLREELAQANSNMAEYKAVYAKQQSVQREVQCLAQNIYFEAASEPRAGKIAVAEVTMNRVKEGFAKTVCGVVTQKNNDVCQFSWVCEPKKAITMPTQWKESREIAENILISHKKYSTIDGALFFHADYVKPAWAATKDFVQKIGRHLFYKE